MHHRDKYGFYLHTKFEHHNYLQMEKYLKDIVSNYPNITKLYSVGRSVEGRELYVLEVTKNPGVHDTNKPEVKYIGNMHGNEVVGREVLLLLIKYLCENYESDDQATRIVNNIRLHIMPSMNPDGYEKSRLGDVDGVVGRENAHNVDLNRNFPDQYETNGVSFLPLGHRLFFEISIEKCPITVKRESRARDKSCYGVDKEGSIRLVSKSTWWCCSCQLSIRRWPRQQSSVPKSQS